VVTGVATFPTAKEGCGDVTTVVTLAVGVAFSFDSSP